jgi:HPt (histidine-containing phosphotransfer) domain-containing protein
MYRELSAVEAMTFCGVEMSEVSMFALAELAERRAGEELLFVVEPRPSPALAADLDENTLRGLTAVMPADALYELLELYIASADERIVEINRQLKLGDLGVVGREAHITISSAGNLGAARVSTLAIHLETACKANNIVEAKAATTALTAAHEVALAAIRNWIACGPDVGAGPAREAAVA